MSAFDDIEKALQRCPPKRTGWARCVFVGPSAIFSMDAKLAHTGGLPFPERFNGAQIHRTQDFPGWEIRDLDSDGKWHDVEPIA